MTNQGRRHRLVTHKEHHKHARNQTGATPGTRNVKTSRRKLKLKLTITCWSGGMNSRAFWMTLQPYICRASDRTCPRMRSASASFCSRLPNCHRTGPHCQGTALPWPLPLPSHPGDSSCSLRGMEDQPHGRGTARCVLCLPGTPWSHQSDTRQATKPGQVTAPGLPEFHTSGMHRVGSLGCLGRARGWI